MFINISGYDFVNGKVEKIKNIEDSNVMIIICRVAHLEPLRL